MTHASDHNSLDVIIAGSGPAGSTAANLLARQGHRVLMIERAQHPRFHIGESMLPLSTPVFDRLGIRFDPQHYQHKNGAAFVDEASGKQVRFSLNGRYQPYQVERAPFDQMMADNAVQHGAALHQQETVQRIDIDTAGVQVHSDRHHYRARYFIDASGRATLMGRKQASIERIENLGRFALYNHYRNADSPTARDMAHSGDIKVLMLDIGWIWIIPLSGRRLSIGLVVQKPLDPAQRGAAAGRALYQHHIHASPFLTDLLAGAEAETQVRAEADFSFSNRRRYGQRYACCGDAAGFLDPIFSSGVFLAVTSAERLADRLHPALLAGTEADPALHSPDDEHYLRAFRSMQLFVERFYRYDMVHHLFFEADRSEAIKNDIAALLSGDLWRDDNDFQRMLLQGRQNR